MKIASKRAPSPACEVGWNLEFSRFFLLFPFKLQDFKGRLGASGDLEETSGSRVDIGCRPSCEFFNKGTIRMLKQKPASSLLVANRDGRI